MPSIAFDSLLDQAVQVSLAAMPAKVGGISEDACPPPFITLVAPSLNHPAPAGSIDIIILTPSSLKAR